MDASLTRGAARRDYWERSVSFVHSADPTLVGFHDCGAAGVGTLKNSFSFVVSAAPTVAMITVPEIFPSVTLRDNPTTMVLLSPAVPPTIHPR